jgi:hypothetical protein
MDIDVALNPNPPDIRISICLHTIYINIIILEHFDNFFNISAIIIWTMEGRGSGEHIVVALTA